MLRAYSTGLVVVLFAVSLIGCGSSKDVAIQSDKSSLPEPTASEGYDAAEEEMSAEGDDGSAPSARPTRSAESTPATPRQVTKSQVNSVRERPREAGKTYATDDDATVRLIEQSHLGDRQMFDRDRFDAIVENGFLAVAEAPLSTFSIDVDTASYAKTRMYLQQRNMLPPPDSVRIEELLNYFDYDYSPPAGDDPFAVHLELSRAPWKPEHLLARIGIKGRELNQRRPISNLVFLIDVSGSMNRPNKLGLVKSGLKLLTTQLNDDDRVSIVVYAGAAGLVLPPTQGDNRQIIMNAVERLSAGGSTNGGQGIQLAYEVARKNFIKGGVNRVLLCTDGDFNLGTTSTGDLVRLAEDQARTGVFLSVLGFGMGNHNDAMLEQISNKANGNYAFIDSEQEARKVLADQLDSTLVTIAKDVKIQIEFNPVHVASYRLIGYENRRLEDRDFNDDTKDAGEIGAGHTVTALYEIVLADANDTVGTPRVDPLKYQSRRQLADAADSDDLLNLKLRFKRPSNNRSELMVFPLKNAPLDFGEATLDFQFATAVAEFGMLLRNSKYRGDASYAAVLEIAGSSCGSDDHGYRSEFLKIATAAYLIVEPDAAASVVWPAPIVIHPSNTSFPLSSQVPMVLLFVAAAWLISVLIGSCVVAWAISARRHKEWVEPTPKAKMVQSPFA